MRSIASKLMMRMLVAAAVILAVGIAVVFQIRAALFEEAASNLMLPVISLYALLLLIQTLSLVSLRPSEQALKS